MRRSLAIALRRGLFEASKENVHHREDNRWVKGYGIDFDAALVRLAFDLVGFHRVISDGSHAGKPEVRFEPRPTVVPALYRGAPPHLADRWSWTDDPVMASTYREAYGGPDGRIWKMTPSPASVLARYSYDREWVVDTRGEHIEDATATAPVAVYDVNRWVKTGELVEVPSKGARWSMPDSDPIG